MNIVSASFACFACALFSTQVMAIGSEEPAGQIEEVVIEKEQQSSSAPLGLTRLELSGDELTVKMAATLGDTLADEPGVHSASYGPGVGLPVLRGLSGVRILLSEDGMGAWDASAISPDHATAIETATAQSIEVIKGPATVLHGNNAVGGTVEVKSGRIAEVLAGEAASGLVEARKELHNEHERESYVGKVRAELGKVVVQFDGFTRESKDMSIPGIAVQEEEIAELFGITKSDNTFGTVLNTDSESYSGSAALSYVGDNGFVGFSTTTVNNEYGIPPGAHTEPQDSPGHSHSHPVGDAIAIQARVRIDLEQERHLFKAGGAIDKFHLDSYRLTMGKVEYTHFEFELDPVTNAATQGTRFHNEVIELKAELDHSLLSFLNSAHHGQLGVQWVDREFAAQSTAIVGGEDFIPATDQTAFGFFAYDQFPFSMGSVEIGLRYEWQKISQRELTAPLLPDDTQFFHEPIEYQTYTASTAITIEPVERHRFILNLHSAQRAPDIQELLSLGPHLATRSYDIGLLIFERQPGESPPKPEKFSGIETRWEWSSEFGELNSSLFYTRVDNFIYQQARESGIVFDIGDRAFRTTCTRLEECIAIFDYQQSDVTLAGYEWQWLLPATELGSGEFQIEYFGDFVRGKIIDAGDLPRMPPRRKGVGMKWHNENVRAGLRYTRVSAQSKAGANETDTAAYESLNANIAYQVHFDNAQHQDFTVFLQMKNLLDKDIRKSTSFLRNFTPEPGREVSLGLRYQF